MKTISKREMLNVQSKNAADLAWKMAGVAQLAKLEAIKNPTPSQLEEIECLRSEIATDSK